MSEVSSEKDSVVQAAESPYIEGLAHETPSLGHYVGLQEYIESKRLGLKTVRFI